MTNWDDEKECLKAVKENGWALQYVKNQTPEICLAAVKEDADALRYVKTVNCSYELKNYVLNNLREDLIKTYPSQI